ncbi:probable glutathione S-transferase parA [Cucurbita pepo subsp. pepo]|uniref:probable glutathione S-transferase parA n=1 Tax=Cucurbita pepo subsp. pepo TaxID=3664 RepID=UPI000C9D38F5|nr:probable glutathione S-transferase parA [Cucurbita pepo subsp. pepo]
MSKDEIIILDCILSPFCMRVKIALNEKGVSYESKEEDLFGWKGGKSELLLKSNPIHKKVPVLLHNGNPLNESSNIVTYIDETWPSSSPLLPSSPYERARARFWIDYIDKKVFETGGKIWRSNGDEQEVAKKEFIEILKQLEEALGDNDFFGGERFGIVDVIAIPFSCWFYAFEKVGGFKVEEHCPKLSNWEKRCLLKESVGSVIPSPEMVYGFVSSMRNKLGLE